VLLLKQQSLFMALLEHHLLALVHLSQQGNTGAFGELYETLFPDLYRYVRAKVRDEDCEDLCTDVFVKVWENLQQYRAQENVSFRSWFFRIAHNTVIDYYRKYRDTVGIDEEIMQIEDRSAEASPDRETNRVLDKEYLLTLLGRLKREYEQVLTLKYLNELSNAEISDVMQKSETAIRILTHRALKQLRRMIEDDEEGRNQ